jgi:hypothetical protein
MSPRRDGFPDIASSTLGDGQFTSLIAKDSDEIVFLQGQVSAAWIGPVLEDGLSSLDLGQN